MMLSAFPQGIKWLKGHLQALIQIIDLSDIMYEVVAVFAIGLFALSMLAYLSSSSDKAKRLPLPPGPTSSWFGNIQLPTSYQWLTYARWKDAFGFVQSNLLVKPHAYPFICRRHHLHQ